MNALQQFDALRQNLANDIDRIEGTLYDMETTYFAAESSQYGTVLKGFDGWLSSKDALRKRNTQRTYKTEDRLFSLSSKTSQATRELEQAAAEAEMPQTGVYGRKGYAQKGYAQKGYGPRR